MSYAYHEKLKDDSLIEASFITILKQLGIEYSVMLLLLLEGKIPSSAIHVMIAS